VGTEQQSHEGRIVTKSYATLPYLMCYEQHIDFVDAADERQAMLGAVVVALHSCLMS
jgi:hypothetical protein